MELQLRYTAAESEESARYTDDTIAWGRDYFARRVNSRWVDERRCIPPHILMDLAKAGMFGFNIEQRFGGRALRAADWGRLLGQFAALDSTIGFVGIINALMTRTYASFASPELQEELLPAFAAGQILGGYAQTEPSAGSDFTAIRTRAEPDPATGGWTINGDKTWIGNAGWSSELTVFAHTDKGLTAFRVPTNAPGVHIGAELNTMGFRGAVQNDIHFHDVAVMPADIIGKNGDGMRVGVDAMTFTRLTIAAHQVGSMKRCVQLMHRFTTRRSVSTGLLAANAVAISFVSECIAMTLAAEAALAKALERLDRGEGVSLEYCALCKNIAAEFMGLVADKALQLLGGRGYDENNLGGQIVRDARVTRIFEGPTELLAEFVGRRLGSARARKHLLDSCGDPEAASRLGEGLDALHDELAAQAGAAGLDDKQVQQWLGYRTGIVAAWSVMAASYQSADHRLSGVQVWLDETLARQLQGSGGQAACILPQVDIETALARFAADIGDVDQTSPALKWETDKLLRRISD